MELKVTPEDFVVEEVLKVRLQTEGAFSVYRLRKTGMDSLEAVSRCAALLGVSEADLHMPALKDRRAVAVQHLAVRLLRPPPKEFGPADLEGQLLGFLDRPLEASDLAFNRFRICLRGLVAEEAQRLRSGMRELASVGLPNYFDTQRFGSYAPSLGFPGKHLLQKKWDEALRCWFTAPQLADDRHDTEEKEILSRFDPDFGAAAKELPRGHRRSLAYYLKDHPLKHRRALERVSPRLLGIWLSAYQSFLWNEAVAERLLAGSHGLPGEHSASRTKDLEFAGRSWPLLRAWSPADLVRWREETLPLPSASLGASREAGAAAFEATLEREGLTWHDLKPRGFEKVWLARARRPLWCFPRALTASDARPDPMREGRLMLEVSFELPPGSYATLVLSAANAQLPTW